jgi:hypothetical protein
LQAGIGAHRQLGRRTDNLHRLEWLGRALLAGIVVLLFILAAWMGGVLELVSP